jgi:hypothetical protein
MTNHFEQFITKKSTQVYPFAFALVPDDLQASQLVIDAIGLMQIDSSISPKLVNYYSNEECLREDQIAITNNLLSHIYRLAKRRISQLNGSCIIPEGHGPFYRTPMNERAILFLREKFSFSWERVAVVISGKKIEVIQDYHLGVNSINELLGHSSETI